MEHLTHFTFLIVCLIFLSVDADTRTENIIFVKPGAGTISAQVELTKYLCKFTYAAQGGTHEEWSLSLEILDGGSAVLCSVDRGIPSYLFFQDFKLELTGPRVSVTDVDVKNSQRDNLNLGQEEYLLDKNSVSSVTGKFKNHLEKVALYSPLTHGDL
uniref:Myeloid-derived growth factor n=1 Tax=Arion vulgaris TaxID=1028688 RepID=A0A0B7AMF3_9EUPU